MTNEENRGLSKLPIDGAFLDYSERSNPFSAGDRTRKYRPSDLRETEANKTGRTDFFEKKLFAIWQALQAPVPYAFETSDGRVRSLDAGCLGFLANKADPEIALKVDSDGFIVAVEPLRPLASRYLGVADRLMTGLTGANHPLRLQQFEGQTAVERELDFQLDERRKVESLRVVREGAREFRKSVLHAWRNQCLFTGCAVLPALEAAHIFPYAGVHTNDVTNGLPLRADLHRLFDRHMVSVQWTRKGLVRHVSPALTGSPYAALEGLVDFKGVTIRPARRVIGWHYDLYRQKCASRSQD